MGIGLARNTAVNDAIDKVSNTGAPFFSAAGNSNSDACNFSPSSASMTISVGATEIGTNPQNQQEDIRSPFSNYGTCVHVFAPGRLIWGAWIGSLTEKRQNSGTSASVGLACGVGALFLAENPGWNFAQLKQKITQNATSGKINMMCRNGVCELSPNLMLFNGCE